MEKMINLKINSKDVSVPSGTTILEAAKKVNVHIPTLCHLDLHKLGFVNDQANCRICMVENGNKMVPACNTIVKEGMNIVTNSIKAIRYRKVNLELILSNHPKDCLICNKNGRCELQSLAASLNVREIRYDGERMTFPTDNSSYSIIRDPDKCILCKRCTTMCNDVQTVGSLTDVGRGFNTVVSTAYHRPMIETNCTFCGQCLAVCPTGALSEVSNIKEVYKAIQDPSKTVIVQTAPAVRVALGEEFGMDPGTIVTGKMVASLRQMGFDYVFDTDFAADLTIMEEATEFVDRFKSNKNLPILTSCCPSWVKFIEHKFPELLDIPSSCKSPHEMFGSVAKTYFADQAGLDSKDIVVVSVMPCVAKKYEANREELSHGNSGDVDYVITTRELASMIKDMNIAFEEIEEDDFDDPLGESTGAGVIFGASGGVLEATLRTAYHIITGKELKEVEFHDLKGIEGIKESVIDIEGRKINVAVANGLGHARTLLEIAAKDRSRFDVIEIMACPGGCIGGGGQPFLRGHIETLVKRMNAIQSEDRSKALRKSYENPSIRKIYDEYLGFPGSEKAHELLHTRFKGRVDK